MPNHACTAGTFSAERLEQIGGMENWHFWFAGRQALVDQLWAEHFHRVAGTAGNLRGAVIDVGCGTGQVAKRLEAAGCRVVGLDRRPEGLAAWRRSSKGALVVQGEAPNMPVVDEAFDGALLLDVLEHVDDIALLRQVHRVLRPGGRLLLTVPALPWLWSYRDEAAGHFRRYTRKTLERTLHEAGLAVVEIRYYQFLLMPLVAVTRLLGRRGPGLRDAEERPWPLVNRLLSVVNRFEVRLGRRVPWPCGSSRAAVCVKP